MSTREQKLEAACRLVLLFYTVGPWDEFKKNSFRELMALIDENKKPSEFDWECTTRAVCDAIRRALDSPTV